MTRMPLDPANPFAGRSTLPFELPDFAIIRTEHYQPAIESGMAEQLAELAAIASNTELPTVANVIEAWEASGQLFTRALKAFQAKQLADTDAELDAIESAIAPRLAAHGDAISLDRVLYDRVVALAARRDAGDMVLDVQEAHPDRRAAVDLCSGGPGRPDRRRGSGH
jgi:peptidyl-dipeptidase Dcp